MKHTDWKQQTAFVGDNGVPLIGISRHRLGTDGDGITTLVGFYGCTLHCQYCLNPQCHNSMVDLKTYTPERLYEQLKVDDLYFRASGGGVTFGGGEPCLAAGFIVRFHELCGDAWKINLETALNVPLETIDLLLPVVDKWIVDVKTYDSKVYREYTGGEFEQLQKNLLHLIEVAKDKVVIKVPVIPGFTTEDDARAGKFQFEQWGFPNVKIIYYTTDAKEQREAATGRSNGKARCEALKKVRRQIAEKYGLPINERECTHQGDCLGNCPLCESELEALTHTVSEKPCSVDNFDTLQQIPAIEMNKFSDKIEEHEINGGLRLPVEPLEGDVAMNPGFLTPPPQYTKRLFKECAVAGLGFHIKANNELWHELEPGMELALIRDRHNKHDSNAVAVALADDYDGDTEDFDFDFILGYIPRTENTEIASLLDMGWGDALTADVAKINWNGPYNDRLHINIYIQSREPEKPYSDCLRIQMLTSREMRQMREELERKGTVYFRWGGFPPWERDLPEAGDKVVFANTCGRGCILYLMRVLAAGDDAAPYLDNIEDLHMVDDCAPYILTNIFGPLAITPHDCDLLDFDNFYSVDEPLTATESQQLSRFFENIHRRIIQELNHDNADANPSIDK